MGSCLIRRHVAIAAIFILGAVVGQAAVCGNGIVESGEECDDGGILAWDGCAPGCSYETVHRFFELELSNDPGPPVCTPTTNALGQAFSTLGLEGLNAGLQSELDDGSIDALMVLLGLDDPTGADDPDLGLGFVSAVPDPRDGQLGLDSWHLGTADSFDASGQPDTITAASLSSSALQSGPADFVVPSSDSDSFELRDGFLLGAVEPATSVPGPPPADLAAGFAAFEAIDGAGPGQGLCGNVTVASLAQIPVPTDFASGGSVACSSSCSGSRAYQACIGTDIPGVDCNSLLDVLVSGCATSVLCVAIVHPTQPDVGAAGGAPAVLSADPVTGIVQVVEPDDAYSSAFEYRTTRVHLTHGPVVFIDGFESGTTDAWNP